MTHAISKAIHTHEAYGSALIALEHFRHVVFCRIPSQLGGVDAI
jgi:hypothetical protein